MRFSRKWLVAVLLALHAAAARSDPGRVVLDTWNAAYVEGHKAGFVHISVHEVEQNGKKLFHTVTELRLSVMRESQPITMGMESGTDETEEGTVTRVFMRQFLGKQQQLVLVGTVEANQLHVQVDGGRRQDKRIPWDARVVGQYRQQRLLKEHEVKPGESLEYLSYEPTINRVVNTRVFVKDYEEVTAGKSKKRLLRVEAIPDKLGGLQLPTLITWLGENRETLRAQTSVPGLGTMVLEPTSEKDATAKNGAASVAGINTLVSLNRFIIHPYQATSAVYRITVKNDDEPTTTFAQDGRQQIKNPSGNSFELHVRAVRSPQPVHEKEEVGNEYLASSFFIACDDPKVRQRAVEAVGVSQDPWEKAVKIEDYVHKRMAKQSLTEAFATADQVAQTMEGDCTEYAVLTAAMCRAVGVPSRTAIGLVYVDHPRRGPCMGFHMWVEVWVHGQWMPIDASLGQGYVGATHIKITDHSWHQTESLSPLLPVVRVQDKLSIEVLRVNGTN
jgi:transglutaminase-like putative cysteine protease